MSMPWFKSCALLDKVLAKQYLRKNTYSSRNKSFMMKFRWLQRPTFISLKPMLGEIFQQRNQFKESSRDWLILFEASTQGQGVYSMQLVCSVAESPVTSCTFWSEALICSQLSLRGFSPTSYAVLHCWRHAVRQNTTNAVRNLWSNCSVQRVQ